MPFTRKDYFRLLDVKLLPKAVQPAQPPPDALAQRLLLAARQLRQKRGG